MHIFHIATAADWAGAKKAGCYETSSAGRTLAEEGFIHAARREQVRGVFDRYYREAGEPLVLLTIDTDRLDCEWREDQVGDDTYPHVYGPITPSAVVDVQPLDRRGGTRPFLILMVGDSLSRVAAVLVAMFLAYAGSLVADHASDGAWAPFIGAVIGLLVGAAAGWLVLRRR